MSLAEKTVKNYVTSVLAKLGMERRTQAAVFAATHEGGVKRDQPTPERDLRPCPREVTAESLEV